MGVWKDALFRLCGQRVLAGHVAAGGCLFHQAMKSPPCAVRGIAYRKPLFFLQRIKIFFIDCSTGLAAFEGENDDHGDF